MKSDSPSKRNQRFAEAIKRLADRKLNSISHVEHPKEWERWFCMHAFAVQVLNYRDLPMDLKMSLHAIDNGPIDRNYI